MDCLGGLCYICEFCLMLNNMQIVFCVCEAGNGHGFSIPQSGIDAW